MYVLDSSVFIEEYDVDGELASVPEVRGELEGASRYRFDAMEGSGMRVEVPSRQVREEVEWHARDTGDFEELSRTDRYLIGVALELDGVLVTDDYAMQNVAERADVEVEVIAKEGIEEERDWKFQCQGCGRVYDEKVRCHVCGSETTRKNPG
ncbi:MAG: NOB1 family endonuclease [Halobacteria archaeon]